VNNRSLTAPGVIMAHLCSIAGMRMMGDSVRRTRFLSSPTQALCARIFDQSAFIKNVNAKT
jgi:hypothetical protein